MDMNAKSEPNTLKYNSSQFIDMPNDENKTQVQQAAAVSFELTGDSNPANKEWSSVNT